ncbi:MAG: ABC transporter ATP-binding protein [Anaerolineales bacterium]
MLEIIALNKSYAAQPLLNDISLTVAAGETLCLLGASGSGKSTLLRIIAGLEAAESGELRWDGQEISATPAHRRNFGLMFQEYALFPHLNVLENVAFGLRPPHLPRAREMLALVKMSGFERRRVGELSGGEQQRVALARALAPAPRLLMLDEPLGALDRALREELLPELRQILRRSAIPAIYVTHDQQEAFTLADKIALLHEGRIVQAGTPPEVFAKPASAWVARFLGLGNLVLAGEISGEAAAPFQKSATLLLRPRARRVVSGGNLRGVVADVLFRGDFFRVTLEGGLFFDLPDAPRLGETIFLQVEAQELCR